MRGWPAKCSGLLSNWSGLVFNYNAESDLDARDGSAGGRTAGIRAINLPYAGTRVLDAGHASSSLRQQRCRRKEKGKGHRRCYTSNLPLDGSCAFDSLVCMPGWCAAKSEWVCSFDSELHGGPNLPRRQPGDGLFHAKYTHWGSFPLALPNALKAIGFGGGMTLVPRRKQTRPWRCLSL